MLKCNEKDVLLLDRIEHHQKGVLLLLLIN
jgi:hypothetical protein